MEMRKWGLRRIVFFSLAKSLKLPAFVPLGWRYKVEAKENWLA